MAHILIAEDEQSISDVVRRHLLLVGHTVAQACTGPQAVELCEKERFDLVLLDVMLPGMDGFEVKRHLPEGQAVIFVTAKTGLSNRLTGLGLGADDYLEKPFEMLELLARIEAVLRRTGRQEMRFQLDECEVDLRGRRAFLRGQPVPLTPQEFALLEILVCNRNIALSRDKLLELAWGYDYAGDTRTVDVHIQRLRRKLALEHHLQTVYKLGYRLSTK